MNLVILSTRDYPRISGVKTPKKHKKLVMTRVAVLALMLLSLLAPATAWDNDDLEIFDLVELINKNFYEELGIKQVRNFVNVDETNCYLSHGSLFILGCNTCGDQASF